MIWRCQSGIEVVGDGMGRGLAVYQMCTFSISFQTHLVRKYYVMVRVHPLTSTNKLHVLRY